MKKWIVEDWSFELTAIKEKRGIAESAYKKGTNLCFHTNVLREYVREL